ncbi:MAG: hypothetical protein WBC70_15795 [Candidatus Aminicenantales bacterium]
MAENESKKLSIEDKMKAIGEAAKEINKLLDEEYYKIKTILDNSAVQDDTDFTLTVGIQNAYLG